MAKYRYRIATKSGEIKEGKASGLFKSLIKRKLQSDGSTTLFLMPDRDSLKNRDIRERFRRFGKAQQVVFFRNMAAMVHSGVSLTEALRIAEEQARHPGLRRVMQELVQDIENGAPLSQSMKKFPNYFSNYILETVHAGEVSGRLSKTLEQIANDIEREHELERDVKAHMAYPVIVVAVMFMVMGVLSVYVLPRIAELFAELRVELPLVTRIILSSGLFIQTNVIAIIVGFIIFSIGFWFVVKKTTLGRYSFHYILLHLPLFGSLVREATLAKFFRSLESLFASDISLVRSVDIAKKTLKNEIYTRALHTTHPYLLQGVKLSDALAIYPHLFPLQTRRMIEVGERAGHLDHSFMHVANYYENSVRYRTKTLTAVIEPVLIVAVGIMVGAVALSIFLPIYQTLPQALV